MSEHPQTASAWGIDEGYWDGLGRWHEVHNDARSAILRAMGADGQEPEPANSPVLTIQAGHCAALDGPTELKLEDGTALRFDESLPPDLPLGYHTLHPLDGRGPTRLIVSPGRCHLPEDLRTWGWTVPLYALRSSQSWGIGDFNDLRLLARWCAKELEAGLLQVNPLNAAMPLLPQQTSPYFPTTRLYRSPLYLHIEDVPGAHAARVALDNLATEGRALNKQSGIDRDRIYRLKMEALEQLWVGFHGHPAFDRYLAEQGDALAHFARFSTLAEHHGTGWQTWPPEHRRHDSPAVMEFAAAHANRVRFHQWVQWLLDVQLARASAELPLMQDLPIGMEANGADAWTWQDLLALDMTVGAPPDEFNSEGQNWGLPPFIPQKLREAWYEPFIQIVRSNLRHAGGLRIDHVMGLFRLFWIPTGMGSQSGTFVRYPVDDLLAILALESSRAGAIVVGEDLGTVEEGVREKLAAYGLLSYRVLWFETDPPARFPRQSLAVVTTHDLATITGLWTGADLRAQSDLGLAPNVEGINRLRDSLASLTGCEARCGVDEVIVRTHEVLAEAPSAIVMATLEDALAVQERANMPNTTGDQRANWSLALPKTLEDLEQDRLAQAVAHALNRRPPA